VAFVRRKGNAYYLVHNVRQRGKVRQLHLACLGPRPRITDDVMRDVSRQHPFLDLDWPRLQERTAHAMELYQPESGSLDRLLNQLHALVADLGELSPTLLQMAHPPAVVREVVTLLRTLHTALESKLHHFERRPQVVTRQATGTPRRPAASS
jgi:hypothetical protein